MSNQKSLIKKSKRNKTSSTFIYRAGHWEDESTPIVFVGTTKEATQFFKSQIKLLGSGHLYPGDAELLCAWDSSTEDGLWASIQQTKVVRAKTKTRRANGSRSRTSN